MKKILYKLLIIYILINPLNTNAIETSATSAILMDMDTKRVLYAKDIHNKRSVASISKVMTAVIAIESNKLDKQAVIGNEIQKSYGSGVYIKQGEKLLLRDLLYGLMLRSGNDAALSIATFVSGDEEKFVDLMNEKAKQLNMNNTVFNNPSGLDQEKGNYSTAYDMAILMSYAMKLDEFKTITKTKTYNLKTNKNAYVWKNKNKLLSMYKYTTGGKTGYTEVAKRTLITTASKEDLNLVVVTLNDGNDWQDHIDLFEYGFNNYTKYRILDKNNINIYDKKYYGNYTLYIKNNFDYLLKESEKENIKIKYNLVKRGNIEKSIGEAVVYLGDEIIHEEKIYVREKEKTSSCFYDILIDWIKKIW